MRWIREEKMIEYREHPENKCGINPDRYFRCRFRVNGVEYTSGLGWESKLRQGRISGLEMARQLTSELWLNAERGVGPRTMKEKRRIAQQERERATAEAEKQAKMDVTFKDFFLRDYWPIAQTSKKHGTSRMERSHFNKWLEPALGGKKIRLISPFDLERIKRKMLKEGSSPRTVQYMLQAFRLVWQSARRAGIVEGSCPSDSVKVDTLENARRRFLTDQEAEKLFRLLKDEHLPTYGMALFSYDSGARFSEIAKLRWRFIDLRSGAVRFVGTKQAGREKSRTVPLTKRLIEMLRDMSPGLPGDLVFPAKRGNIKDKVSYLFAKCVEKAGLNDGVEDARDRVVFHTLRHSCASRLVRKGVDLFRVQKILGHSSIKVTENYAHLRQDSLREAMKELEK